MSDLKDRIKRMSETEKNKIKMLWDIKYYWKNTWL